MKYWKIQAGRRKRDPDKVKSVTLGDWLRKGYISIKFEDPHPQYKAFKEDMVVGDRVVLVSDGYVWALGTIKSDFEERPTPRGSYIYNYARKVVWQKVCRAKHTDFPPSLRNKLRTNRTVTQLSHQEWKTLETNLP